MVSGLSPLVEHSFLFTRIVHNGALVRSKQYLECWSIRTLKRLPSKIAYYQNIPFSQLKISTIIITLLLHYTAGYMGKTIAIIRVLEGPAPQEL